MNADRRRFDDALGERMWWQGYEHAIRHASRTVLDPDAFEAMLALADREITAANEIVTAYLESGAPAVERAREILQARP